MAGSRVKLDSGGKRFQKIQINVICNRKIKIKHHMVCNAGGKGSYIAVAAC